MRGFWFVLLCGMTGLPLIGQTTRLVETVRWTELRDADRGRTLAVTVCFPRPGEDGKDAPLPVIVFSHGAYGEAKQYLPLAEYWASHGYACVLPTHADSVVYEKRDDSNDPWPGPEDYGVWGKPTTQGTWKQIWSERPRDLLFLLRRFDLIEEAVPALRGRLDREHVGVGGHSLGSFAAMLVCGGVVDIPGVGPGQSFADPKLRLAAAMLISPSGRGQQGLRDGSWDRLTLPMLVVTGEYDTGIRGEVVTWREEPYLLSPPGDKYLLVLKGANHNSYFGRHVEEKDSNLPLQRKGEADRAQGEQILHDTQRVTLAFWDAYLKGDPAAKEQLRGGSQNPAGQVEVKHR